MKRHCAFPFVGFKTPARLQELCDGCTARTNRLVSRFFCEEAALNVFSDLTLERVSFPPAEVDLDFMASEGH